VPLSYVYAVILKKTTLNRGLRKPLQIKKSLLLAPAGPLFIHITPPAPAELHCKHPGSGALNVQSVFYQSL